MTSVADAKQWQRNRALDLHAAFTGLAVRVHGDGMKLMPSLEALSQTLNGRVITAGVRGERRLIKSLRCSAKTLYKEWRRWQDGGCTPEALILNYKAGQERIPPALVAEIQRRATLKTGGRNHDGLTTISAIYQWLKRDFEARLPIPGLNYDEIAEGADFPYSERTICRHAPPKAERALGNRGVAAFRARAAFVQMDYSKLRKCELLTADDVRIDLLCIDDFSGKAIEVVCYVLMEVASRLVIAFFLKPKKAICAEDVDELFAHGLQTPGFGIGQGYVTHILLEKGAVACSLAAQAVLEGVTHGAIKIHRTSMNGGVTWTGAERDRASGNAAGKGVIESFNRRLHTALIPLPGQIGNNWGNTPASVGYGSKTPGTLVYECERLEQFAKQFGKTGKGRLKLQLPMLRLSEVQQAVKAAIDKHNHEPAHDYQDHGSFTQAEVAPGVWREQA